jgi:multiple sugar transport system substrate-binding protein
VFAGGEAPGFPSFVVSGLTASAAGGETIGVKLVRGFLIVVLLAGLVGCSVGGASTATIRAPIQPTLAPVATPTDSAEVIDTPTPDKTAEARSLNVLLVTHPTSDVVQQHIGEFEAATGAQIKLEIGSYNAVHQDELIDLGAGTRQYDVMMVLDTWLPEFVNSGNLQELRLQLRKLDDEGDYQWLPDLVPNANTLLGQWQGKQIDIPLAASTQLLMYRKDLFEQQRAAFKLATGRELTVPTTWKQFNEVARFFTRSLNPQSPVAYGLSAAGAPGNSALCLFQTILWGMGGREFAKKWRVTVNNREGLQAMQLWAEQAGYAPPDAPRMYWNEMNAVFEGGDAAMQIQWDAFARSLETAVDSNVKGKVGYALVPGEPDPAPVIAGWVLVINKNSKRVPLAWDFVRWVTGPEFSRTLNEAGGQVPRISLYTDKDLQARNPHYAAVLASLEKAQQRTSYAPGGPTLFAQDQYETILGGAAAAVFAGQKAPQEALDDAADDLGKMLEQIGRR